MSARLIATQSGIEFYSPYDADLVGSVKALPYVDRKWQPDKKCWLVATKHKDALIKLCEQHLGSPPHLQGTFAPQKTSQTKLFRVEYIGGLKDRGDGKLSAMGAIVEKNTGTILGLPVNTIDWSILFPESVLRNFFEGYDAKESMVTTTYYSILALKRNCDQDEIKSAYRKMARRYHPDVNKDDDAHEMMIKIQKAYEILRNPTMRNRYDAGLKLQNGVNSRTEYNPDAKYWRPPIRCGLILCDGYYEVGRFVVTKILEWKDIIENGRMLITSWSVETNSLIRNWI